MWEDDTVNLEECKREMRSIIQELRDIEWDVRHNFTGIGEQLCGDCIDKIADKYDYVSHELSKVNYNFIASLIERD
jgi:hypothetical protein